MNYQDWIKILIPEEISYERWCKSKIPERAELRDAIIYVLITKGKLTRKHIGNILGKNQSSITNSYQRTKERIDSDLHYWERLRNMISEITRQFNSLPSNTIFFEKDGYWHLNECLIED